jgi:AhpC/TSA family
VSERSDAQAGRGAGPPGPDGEAGPESVPEPTTESVSEPGSGSAGPGLEHRLDPDRAAATAAAQRPAPTTPAIDTRPYRRAIGAFAFALVVVISVVLFLTRGVGTVGVAAGQRLHNFAAPVATSNLVGDPNFSKPCQLGYFGARALNTCLLARRTPLVLAFFVTGSDACVRQVDTLQQVSHQFGAGSVTFAAVAVSASKRATAKLVRRHGWTIPVAYDRDGSVGSIYGVAICPLVELASRGGVVKFRLIGERWLQPSALAAKVRALAG